MHSKVWNKFWLLKTLYLDCCPEVVGHVGKPTDKKPKANLKIYSVRVWLVNSYSSHFAQYIKK